ncbi:MAG: YczE/YyaS/YitT family protein [Candidatus Thalassarchaeaceae archaeon]
MDWNNLLKPAKKVPSTNWSSSDPMSLKPKISTIIILILGLWVFGTGDAIIVAAGLGVAPWTVLAQGISEQINWTLGQTTFLVSVIVLFLWIPIKERPGLGTILNAILIALAIDVMLPYLPTPDIYFLQILQVLIGTIFVGIGSGLYLTANLGPGPRDGWMTGIQRITNVPIARVRATIEITVLLLGYYLGGTVGLGTVIFALFIGHVVAICLQITKKIDEFFPN